MLQHGWPGREDFCRDRIFYVATKLAKVRRNLGRDRVGWP